MKNYLILFIILVQYSFPTDSINIALYGKPFVKYVGSLPPYAPDPNLPDTSRMNPNYLIDKNYFSILELPAGPVSNIGTYFGVALAESVTVSSVRITNFGNSWIGFNLRLQAFTIYGSRDSISWSKLYQIVNNKDSANHLAYIASRDRWKYLKVTADSMNPAYSTVISEFEVYSASNPNIVDGQKLILNPNYLLLQNYPNPFNPQTHITFGLAANGFTSLTIYDVLGREVSSIVNEMMEAGTHSRDFSSTQLNSGVYFYTLRSGNFTETKKMMILK